MKRPTVCRGVQG
uniref:Uncharacterized protein n=1 Tax=Anguilla anguilla TaxID=7936 RepID=A0A0E9Q9W0_ANGAN